MAKKSARKKSSGSKEAAPGTEPWLSRRTGLLIMGLVSLALATFVTWQLSAGLPFGEALLWGLGFGLATWGVFWLALSFNRFVRGRR